MCLFIKKGCIWYLHVAAALFSWETTFLSTLAAIKSLTKPCSLFCFYLMIQEGIGRRVAGEGRSG